MAEDNEKTKTGVVSDRIGFAQWVLETNLHWIAASETKVGFVVGIDLAMVGALAAAIGANKNAVMGNIGWIVLAGLLFVAAFFCACVTVVPRTEGPARSMIFFGRIAKTEPKDFVAEFTNATDDELLRDVLQQAHRNAEIASVKHTWVWRAMLFSMIGAVPWLVSIWKLIN
jgi:hypothetical protein